MTIYKLSKLTRFNNTQWFDEELIQYFANFSDAEKVMDVLESLMIEKLMSHIKLKLLLLQAAIRR